MEDFRDSPQVLSICMDVFSHAIGRDRSDDEKALIQKELIEIGGAQTCVLAMQAQPDSLAVQQFGTRTLSRLIGRETLERVVDSDSVQVVAKAMEKHYGDSSLQGNSLCFIGNIGHFGNGEDTVIRAFRENDIVELVRDILS